MNSVGAYNLYRCGQRADTVDKHAEKIVLLKRAIIQQTILISIPNPGILSLSFSSLRPHYYRQRAIAPLWIVKQ